MKLLIKISLWALSLAGVFLLVLPINWFPNFYDVRYMGICSLIGACVIYFLPQRIRVAPNIPGAEQKNQGVEHLQVLLTCIILSNALGDLGFYQLYKFGFEFDKLMHFFNPMLILLLFPIFLQKRFGIRKSYSQVGTFVFAICIGIFWELFEFFTDQIFKTHIYGIYGTNINNDTKWDLLFDLFGSTFGLIASLFYPRTKTLYK